MNKCYTKNVTNLRNFQKKRPFAYDYYGNFGIFNKRHFTDSERISLFLLSDLILKMTIRNLEFPS